MSPPRCPTCRWHLAFVRKRGAWIALCPNPDCAETVIEP